VSERRQLRPLVPTEPASSPEEQFQNETLRPILKMQNDLLVLTFQHYLVKRKTRWEKLSPQQRQAYLLHSIRKDSQLRQLLFGLVLGQCTQEELRVYYNNEQPLNRRLGKLLEQRLEDQLLS
jgi:hypothetical protein